MLFEVIADLQSQGVGIIYISHRMEEIFKITDRISVLRTVVSGHARDKTDQRRRGHTIDDWPRTDLSQ